jgi:hypothetical protein
VACEAQLCEVQATVGEMASSAVAKHRSSEWMSAVCAPPGGRLRTVSGKEAVAAPAGIVTAPDHWVVNENGYDAAIGRSRNLGSNDTGDDPAARGQARIEGEKCEIEEWTELALKYYAK